MVAKKNLVGMKFGSLTVIKEVGSNKDGRALWLCRCNCGEERIAPGKDLGKKVTRCPKKCILTEDLTGKRFGNLLVIKQEGSDKHGFRQFRCRCMTPLKDLQDDRLENQALVLEGHCGTEILINAVGLKQSFKNSKKRKIPKSCFECSRILWGSLKRKSNPKEDLTGQTFGKLTAIRSLFKISNQGAYKRPMYECVCSCGSGLVSYVRREALIGKSVRPIRSCGCLQIEAAKQNKTNMTHGLSKHPLYKVRSNMIKRCYQSRNSAYSRYGARGIEICDAWLEDFRTFYSWAMEQGWTREITIDRINNDGPYSPENCQLLSRAKNALKMQSEHGHGFFIAGQQVNINELSKNSQVSAALCKKLLSNGYSQADVFACGKLELHQKNALSRSIHKGNPITLEMAAKTKRIAQIKTPQSSEIGSYRAMMARCYNPKDHSYHNYGTKGIEVCPEWKNNPAQFLSDMGPKPEPKAKHALDRIDPTKGYFPANCRWLSVSENSRRITKHLKKELTFALKS